MIRGWFQKEEHNDGNLLLTTPRTVDHEPEQRGNTDDDLVKEVDDHVTVSGIRPMSMHEQQPLQESELYAMISI